MKRLFIFLAVYSFMLEPGMAQKDFYDWFFGYNSGLYFSSCAPVFISGALTSLEGCSSISDKNGNLLFYTNGKTVWNKNNLPMPNGTGLNGDTTGSQSAIITTHPGD